MAEEKKPVVASEYNLDAKWDACLDLGVRRFTYLSLIGGFAGLLLFRTTTSGEGPRASGEINMETLMVAIMSVKQNVNQRMESMESSRSRRMDKIIDRPHSPNSVLSNPPNSRASLSGHAPNELQGSPVTRWASTTFGAGLGIGSSYTECSHKFGGYPGKSTASISENPITKVGDN